MKIVLTVVAATAGIVLLAATIYRLFQWFNHLDCDQFSCLGLLVLSVPVIFFLTILLVITCINFIAYIIQKYSS